MSAVEKKPYGSWVSPLAASQIAAGVIKVGQPQWDGDDLYWLEGRPLEGGRNVIVRRSAAGKIEDMIHAPFNARTRVHEYGGGDFLVADGTIYFSNFADQQIYVCRAGSLPTYLAGSDRTRFADYNFDRKRKLLFCVMETHGETEHDVKNSIVSINEKGEITPVAEGCDFYASPRVSPDGRFLCYMQWNHPNMPWDECELQLCELNSEGRVSAVERIAGGKELSVSSPQWGADGTLFFVNEETGFWNLYKIDAEYLTGSPTKDLYSKAVPVLSESREHGLPAWVFGMSTYAPLKDGNVLLAANDRGTWELLLLEKDGAGGHKPLRIKAPYTSFGYVKAGNKQASMCAGSPETFNALVSFDLKEHTFNVERNTTEMQVEKKYISKPQTIEFETAGGKTAFAFFYPPKNEDFEAPKGELPPLIVFSHGGPTGQTSNDLRLSVQYWTSRGFAIVDVNYGGSTGFGREYRERLKRNWGIVDMQDCENAARYLANKGLVDRERMAIAGGSAGGYTTLCALTFGEIFRAGASHFGVSDLEALALDTHKFESRYLDRLVGDYPAEKDIYTQRSPIHHTDKLSCPIIFLQGTEDKVVPPSQSEAMVKALEEKKLPVAYVLFEGEQHGFRQAKNIARALEAELYFYSRVFDFELGNPVEPVEIINEDALTKVAGTR